MAAREGMTVIAILLFAAVAVIIYLTDRARGAILLS